MEVRGIPARLGVTWRGVAWYLRGDGWETGEEGILTLRHGGRDLNDREGGREGRSER